MSARKDVLDKRQQIRSAIREAAIEEFALKGLDGASTQAIAKRAGLSKPQLHYYISSKEELYEEVILSITEEWSDMFFLSTNSEDPAEIIVDYIGRKIRHALRHPQITRLFANEIARGAPILRRHWERSRESVRAAADVIARWVEEERIRPVDPFLFQMHMWAITQHYADYEAQVRYMLQLGDDEPLDEDRIVGEATRMFLRICGLPEAPAEKR